MKKLLPFIAVIAIIIVSITFLDNKDTQEEQETTDVFDKYKEEFNKECYQIKDFHDLNTKLIDFSKNREIPILTTGKSFVMIGNDNPDNTCIYMNLDFNNGIKNEKIGYIPICLYVIKNNPKINLLITESKAANNVGIDEIKNLKCKKLINIRSGEKNKCYTKGASDFDILLQKKLTKENHKYDLNYAINISDVSFSEETVSNMKDHPMYLVSKMFTYLKTHDVLYQLNDINGNSKKFNGSQNLNLNFSVSKNSKDTFEKQLENIKNDFEDNSDIENSFKFEVTNVKDCDFGFNTEDSDSIFNLFYILKDEIIKMNKDEEIVAKTAINKFFIKEDVIYFNIDQQGKTIEDLKNVKTTLDETAKLLGFESKVTKKYEAWEGSSNNLVNYLNNENFDIIKSGKMDLHNLNYLNSKFANMDIIFLQFEEKAEYNFFSYILNNL